MMEFLTTVQAESIILSFGDFESSTEVQLNSWCKAAGL